MKLLPVTMSKEKSDYPVFFSLLVVCIENKDPTHSINKVKNQVHNR